MITLAAMINSLRTELSASVTTVIDSIEFSYPLKLQILPITRLLSLLIVILAVIVPIQRVVGIDLKKVLT